MKKWADRKKTVQRRSGMALILVMIVSVVLAGIAGIAALIALNSSQTTARWGDTSNEAIACESVGELLRAEVVADFESSGLTAQQWFAELRSGARYGAGIYREYAGFPGVRAWVDRAAPEGDGSLWVEIICATIDGAARSDQRFRQRIRFGNGNIMDFALLAKTVNCMFCHLRVTGDVGAIGNLDLGWGGANSSAGEIDGNVYVTGSARRGTGSYSGTLNGTTLNGDLYEYYHGSKLPEDEDGDGNPDFPAIIPAQVAAAASGRIWAGDSSNNATDGSGIWVTPLLGKWNPSLANRLEAPPAGSTGNTWKPASSAVLGPVVSGNLTLIGTAGHPILLDKEVFITGDVVIKGQVSGRGAIYAGRNIYIAGDLVYGNPPAAMAGDADAQAALQALKDELRLAARANIIIGNWTYRMHDVEDELERMRNRQGQNFLASSFGLNAVRYFEATDGGNSSNELTWLNGKYYNDRGEEVPSSQVVTIDDGGTLGWSGSGGSTEILPKRYDAVIAPGQVNSDGSFKSWMSQEEFREVLGTQVYQDMVWRMPQTSDASILNKELGAGWDSRYNSMSSGQKWYDDDYFGEPGKGLYVSKGGSTYVMETGAKGWPAQVTHIDAALYSNKRIGGLTSMILGLTINGTLISGNVQVLAAGRGNFTGWFTSTPDYGDPLTRALSWQDTTGTNAFGDLQNGFYLKYDYRLRNGGLGFGLIDSATGERIFFVREKS